MAEQLTAENLESYSIEAISNYGRAIEDFSDVLVSIKSEDANVSVFNSLYIMIEGKKRRLYDLANVESPEDALKLEVMVYSRENVDIVKDTIKESGFPAKSEPGSQYINVRVPPPSRMQLEEIADDLIRRTNGMTSRLMKLKTNTGLRIRAAVQNEFIDTRVATLSTRKIDSAYERFNKEARLLGLLRRKQILGKYFKPQEKDDEALSKDVNLFVKLNKNIDPNDLSDEAA
jgi:ribosome recycling factor|tara:strand:+ start:1473 stop:2165 length:693 start_codon:yes stop_codon:yes gene_type:complete